MAKGDHLYIKCFGYEHHGIDCGDGNVIHYVGHLKTKENAYIGISSLREFASGKKEIFIIDYDNYCNIKGFKIPCYPDDEVVKNAKSRLKENKYDLFFNNCEHFAFWCKTGISESKQIKDLKDTIIRDVPIMTGTLAVLVPLAIAILPPPLKIATIGLNTLITGTALSYHYSRTVKPKTIKL